MHRGARGKPRGRYVADGVESFCVNDGKRIDTGGGYEQPAAGFVKHRPDGKHSAVSFEARYAEANFLFDLERGGIDDGDGVVVGVRDEGARPGNRDGRRPAAAAALGTEG